MAKKNGFQPPERKSGESKYSYDSRVASARINYDSTVRRLRKEAEKEARRNGGSPSSSSSSSNAGWGILGPLMGSSGTSSTGGSGRSNQPRAETYAEQVAAVNQRIREAEDRKKTEKERKELEKRRQQHRTRTSYASGANNHADPTMERVTRGHHMGRCPTCLGTGVQ